MNTQASLRDVTNDSTRYYAAPQAQFPQDAPNVIDVMVDPSNDNAIESRQQEPIEPPRKRTRELQAHFHFDAFRF
jgi:hypothetical protein